MENNKNLVDPNQLSLSKLNVLGQQLATIKRLVEAGFNQSAVQEIKFLEEELRKIRVVSSKLIAA